MYSFSKLYWMKCGKTLKYKKKSQLIAKVKRNAVPNSAVVITTIIINSFYLRVYCPVSTKWSC